MQFGALTSTMAVSRPKAFVILSFLCVVVVLARRPSLGSLMIEPLTSDFEQEVDESFDYLSERDTGEHLSNRALVGGLEDGQKYSVFCGEDAVEVFLPSGSLSEVKVFDLSGIYGVLEAPDSCGYSLTRQDGRNILHVSYSGCHVTVEEGRYTLRVLYRNDAGQYEIATTSCDANSSHTPSQKISCSQSGRCSHRRPLTYRAATLPPTDWVPLPPTPMTTFPPSRTLRLSYKQGGCSIPVGQRLPCGPRGTTAAQCQEKGCCMDTKTSACYYRMDECSADGHFVFAVPSDAASVPLNPAALMVVGRTSCKPVIANKQFAVFKFALTECGTRSYRIGDTTIYLAEVWSAVRTLNLKYGIITRDHPIRLMVECRYSNVSLDAETKGWASTGYMVTSVSLPSLVRAKGLYGVQLRIAEDKTFTSFLPEYHQPLRVLLGNPVYLEVRLNAPNPKATLVVHYCVAYPRSARSALVLLYEGCPNPHDSDNIAILYVADLPQNRHQRRFEVRAFQFMDQSTNKYLNEEIYFMCSAEVCLPSQTPCKETCFDTKP